jgi:hypothetical protein
MPAASAPRIQVNSGRGIFPICTWRPVSSPPYAADGSPLLSRSTLQQRLPGPAGCVPRYWLIPRWLPCRRLPNLLFFCAAGSSGSVVPAGKISLPPNFPLVPQQHGGAAGGRALAQASQPAFPLFN